MADASGGAAGDDAAGGDVAGGVPAGGNGVTNGDVGGEDAAGGDVAGGVVTGGDAGAAGCAPARAASITVRKTPAMQRTNLCRAVILEIAAVLFIANPRFTAAGFVRRNSASRPAPCHCGRRRAISPPVRTFPDIAASLRFPQ